MKISLDYLRHTSKTRTSNCCGAPVYDDTDICSDPKCGEHCTVEITCSECGGSGINEIGIKESFASQRIDQRFKKEECQTCSGLGYIEED